MAELRAELDLKTFIAETREVAQALVDFANNLEEIDKKYSEANEELKRMLEVQE